MSSQSRHCVFALLILLSACRAFPAPSTDPIPAEPGLLFYLSGEKGAVADYAANGAVEPTFCTDVEKVADGAIGSALQCGDLQRLAFLAPGNIYSQRGTLAFFWRSRDPVGPTEFPVFRVAFGDHSSWDMVWLRIDYNGHGFDAFVTDASLARVRVSCRMDAFPKPEEWVHLALSWDETWGIRFYVNGKLAAEKACPALLDTALDQFGPHSRIISPHQVQSDYNFVRGGDIDEVRIYDRPLAVEAIARLAAKGAAPVLTPVVARSLSDAICRQEWFWRFGWNRPYDPPPLLEGAHASVRKVEIHEAYDLKRWWWKANDGIRETTWPGVYNRSRIPGRNDYFQLPDWDCYSLSGKAITFTLPQEPWNQIEISGAAFGSLSLVDDSAKPASEKKLAERPSGQEKTVTRLQKPETGHKLRFTNREQETPIGEFAVYNVGVTPEPAGSTKLAFRLDAGDPASDPRLGALWSHILGRHLPDERSVLIGAPASGSVVGTAPAHTASDTGFLPVVNILIPDTWDKIEDGLDGIAIDLPALAVKPTHGALFPLNIQVKDPLWPMRNLCDFSFSVKPGKAVTLWLDLRDKILPQGKSLYLTIAGAGQDFGAAALVGAEIRLVFKPRAEARKEHEIDRFTQARDSYAMLVEEHPMGPKFALWVRFENDITDLLRVSPDHEQGCRYWAVAGPNAPKVSISLPPVPAGIPGWAFRQVDLLERVGRFVAYYIDKRQIENGELGGGISDDTDLLNLWPGVALMGVDPEKITNSVSRLLDAAFANGMFTNGVSTIQTDELHSYEEGINSIGQVLLLNHGSPRQFERAMNTARAMERVTGINLAGHRHFRSSYYSGTKMATDSVWGWSKAYNYLVLQPSMFVTTYNGNPSAKRLLLELADGLLAHRHVASSGRSILSSSVHFETDKEGQSTRPYIPYGLFWLGWEWTKDARYLDPIYDGFPFSVGQLNANLIDRLELRSKWVALSKAPRSAFGDSGNPGTGKRRPDSRTLNEAERYFRYQISGDTTLLEKMYASQIEAVEVSEFINTEGSLWIDRVGVPTVELQRSRLGGVALTRNGIVPGHAVSWSFKTPAKATDVAILIPDATPTSMSITVFNLSEKPVQAQLTGWGIDPGLWEIEQGIDGNGDGKADAELRTQTLAWERSRSLDLSFPPRVATLIRLKLKTPGTPYWQRPDLGIDPQDVVVSPGKMSVTVHSLGAIATPAIELICRSAKGKVVAKASIPALEAPTDLKPRTTQVELELPSNYDLAGASVEIDPDAKVEEITRLNNKVRL